MDPSTLISWLSPLRRLLLTTITGLLIFTGTTISIFRLLETFLVIEKSVIRADALVVMAGSQCQRLPATVRLYKQGIAPKILLTNDGTRGPWSQTHRRNLLQVEWAREYLVQEGVPSGAIEILNYTSSGSVFDAINTRDRVVIDSTIRSLLVVTSDYHTRRTLWIFQRVFEGKPIQISIYPVIDKNSKGYGQRFFILAYEFTKLTYYKMKYGLFPIQSGTVIKSILSNLSRNNTIYTRQAKIFAVSFSNPGEQAQKTQQLPLFIEADTDIVPCPTWPKPHAHAKELTPPETAVRSTNHSH